MKKHFGKFGIALVAALLMLLTCALCASAAGTATVVYLGDKGGDGLTPETATSSINTAYSLLDPDKDCTVVLCGKFAQVGNFARGHAAKSITITSVYDGVDYRKSGAVYKTSKSARFGLADDTTFENMTFESSDGTSFLVVGQHHAVTIGEGVTMNNFVGTADGNAFWIVGGCQWGFGGGPTGATYTTDALKNLMQKPTDVTVLSGNDMIVVGGPRGNSGAEANRITGGDIHITIGGTARVAKLDAAGSGSKYTDVGNINVRVIGGSVNYLYGTRVNNMTAQNFTLLWTGGSIATFKMMPSGTAANPVGLRIADGGDITLEATADIQSSSSYAVIYASGFTAKATHEHDFDTENGKVLTPATCRAEGKALCTCKTCSATEEVTLPKTNHAFGEWTTTTPAGFGTKGEEKRTCAYCNVSETREIPAQTAKLELGSNSLSAETNKAGEGTIRMIVKLVTAADANVTRYGIFVAKTSAIGDAKLVAYTKAPGTETTLILDLAFIPHDELDTPVYAWAFAEADGVQITLPLAVGASVNTIIG